MQKLTDSHGFGVADRALRRVRVRLQSREATRSLADDIAKVRGELRAAVDAFEALEDERQSASAELQYRDALLDAWIVKKLSPLVDATFAGEPDLASLRATLFGGKAPSEGVRPVGGNDQRYFVEGIIGQLESNPRFVTLRDHAPALRALHDAVVQAEKDRDAWWVKEDVARGAFQRSLTAARKSYNQIYPRLQLLFPNDAALVESFFMKLRKDASTDEDPAPVAPPATP